LEAVGEFRVVRHCATVTEAIQIVAKTPIDVILLDYDLGSEFGTNLVKQLGKAMDEVKVILVTEGN